MDMSNAELLSSFILKSKRKYKTNNNNHNNIFKNTN